jgi:hypothetical protein
MSEPARATRTCRCHHCKADGFNRGDLTTADHPKGAFLCATCRELPNVRGYPARGANRAERFGVTSGTEYERQSSHLNIVRDDDSAPTAPMPASSPSVSAPPEQTAATASGFDQWLVDVRASAVPDSTKLYLLTLATWATHHIGSNCYPSRRTVALSLGWSKDKVRYHERKATAAGWLRIHPTRVIKSGEQSSHTYQFLNALREWAGPVEIAPGRANLGDSTTATGIES